MRFFVYKISLSQPRLKSVSRSDDTLLLCGVRRVTSAYVCACPAVPRSIPKDSAAYLTGVGGDIVLGWVCGWELHI